MNLQRLGDVPVTDVIHNIQSRLVGPGSSEPDMAFQPFDVFVKVLPTYQYNVYDCNCVVIDLIYPVRRLIQKWMVMPKVHACLLQPQQRHFL